MRFLPTTLLFVLAICHPCNMQAAEFYVAPDGNDAWSGRLADPNAARNDGPLATPTAARNKIRQMRAAGGQRLGPVTVYLRGGVYRLAEPLVLEARGFGHG